MPRTESTAAAVSKEVELKGNFQHAAHEQNTERHPASVPRLANLPSKYAYQTTYVEPEGTVSAVAGSTLRFCVPRCNGYLYNCSLEGKVTKTATTQADGNTTANTAFYKDDAWFLILEEVRMEFGCESVHLQEEDGKLWAYKYNHFYSGDKRLGVLVNDGAPVARADWARETQTFRVPFLFDVFSHKSKALRVWTMQDSPVRFRVKLRPMSYVTEYTGTAITGGTIQAGFGPGELQEVRLACDFIQLPVKDAERLERAAPERITYVREWLRYRNIPHSQSTSTEIIDLAVTNSLESLLIFPSQNRYIDSAAAITAAGSATPNLLPLFDFNLYPLAFSGVITQDGSGFRVSDPFAGAELKLDGSTRESSTYKELTGWKNVHLMARNSTDVNELVAGFHFHDPMSPTHGPSIQMTQINHKKLYLYWLYDGVTVPNWDGEIDIYASIINVLVTDGHRIRKVYPS